MISDRLMNEKVREEYKENGHMAEKSIKVRFRNIQKFLSDSNRKTVKLSKGHISSKESNCVQPNYLGGSYKKVN